MSALRKRKSESMDTAPELAPLAVLQHGPHLVPDQTECTSGEPCKRI